MENEVFYMTLLSGSFMNMFLSYKQSKLTVELDHQIMIAEESLEATLVEIATSSEVLSITEENKIVIFGFS